MERKSFVMVKVARSRKGLTNHALDDFFEIVVELVPEGIINKPKVRNGAARVLKRMGSLRNIEGEFEGRFAVSGELRW